MRIRLRLHGAGDGLAARLAAPLAERWPGVLAGDEPGVTPLTVDVTGLDDEAALFAVCVQLALAADETSAQPLPNIGGHGVSRRGLFGMLGVGAGEKPEPVPRLRAGECQLGSGCRRCIGACSAGALAVAQGRLGLDADLCTRCGCCVAACPVGVLDQPPASQAGVDAVLDQVRQAAASHSGIRVVFACSSGPVRPWTAEIPVADVGAVGVRWLVAAAASGADEVTVRCMDSGCAGRDRADATVAVVAGLLGGAGPVVRCPGRAVDAPEGADAWGRFAAQVVALGRPDASGAGLGFVDAQVAPGCTSCGACAQVCPRGAWRLDGGTLDFRASVCSGCGACIGCCPEHVLAVPASDAPLAQLFAWRTVHTDDVVRCRRCGRPVGSRAMLTRVATMLGTPVDELCPACKQEAVL